MKITHGRTLLVGVTLLFTALIGTKFEDIMNQFKPTLIAKSPNDERTYRALTLSNGLRVTLVNDPKAENSSAVMTIRAGYENDPFETPGLAHFVEHMLFLGTKSYPDSKEYQEYLATHGGYSNAYTDSHETQFYYNVNSDNFKGALERFAGFFTEPLFTAEWVDRERNAVDSEYKLRIMHDGFALQAVGAQTRSPNYPAPVFSIGSLETLSNEQGDLRQKSIDFYNRYYHTANGSLALVAKESLDEQEALVKKLFSDMPKGKHETPLHQQHAFEAEQLERDLKIQSKQNNRALLFDFYIPRGMLSTTPAARIYISYLFNRQGMGSLNDYLQEKQLASNLSVHFNSLSANQMCFTVSMDLTDKGIESTETISNAILSYIDYLREHKFLEANLKDFVKSNTLQFNYEEPMAAAALAQSLSLVRYDVAPEKLLTHRYVLDTKEVDFDEVASIVNAFTTKNLRRVLMSPSVQTDQIEPYFQYGYKNEPLNISLAKSDAQFGEPTGNPYTPESFALLSSANNGSVTKIETYHNMNTWHGLDTSFKVPKVIIGVAFIFPPNTLSLDESVALYYFSKAFKAKLRSIDDLLTLAQVNMFVSMDEMLSISLSGFSDKHEIWLKDVIKHLKETPISEGDFRRYKEELLMSLRSEATQAPYYAGQSKLRDLITANMYLNEQFITSAEKVTLEQVMPLVQAALNRSKAESLIYGNLDATQAQAAARVVYDGFVSSPVPVGDRTHSARLKLSSGFNKAWTFSTEHKDNFTSLYIQAPDRSDRTQVTCDLIAALLNTEFYNQLRTKHQLGYVVNMSSSYSGLNFLVQSPSTNPEGIKEHIYGFINNMNTYIDAIDEQTFSTTKESLKQHWLEKPRSLGEAIERPWTYIVDGSYRLDKNKIKADMVVSLSKQDLKNYINDNLLEPSTRRSITVQVGQDKEPAELLGASTFDAFKAQGEYFVIE